MPSSDDVGESTSPNERVPPPPRPRSSRIGDPGATCSGIEAVRPPGRTKTRLAGSAIPRMRIVRRARPSAPALGRTGAGGRKLALRSTPSAAARVTTRVTGPVAMCGGPAYLLRHRTMNAPIAPKAITPSATEPRSRSPVHPGAGVFPSSGVIGVATPPANAVAVALTAASSCAKAVAVPATADSNAASAVAASPVCLTTASSVEFGVPVSTAAVVPVGDPVAAPDAVGDGAPNVPTCV
jgi:hypothetical protein